MQLLTRYVKSQIPTSAWAKQQGTACLVGVKYGEEDKRRSLMDKLKEQGFHCRIVQTPGKFGELCFVVTEDQNRRLEKV